MTIATNMAGRGDFRQSVQGCIILELTPSHNHGLEAQEISKRCKLFRAHIEVWREEGIKTKHARNRHPSWRQPCHDGSTPIARGIGLGCSRGVTACWALQFQLGWDAA